MNLISILRESLVLLKREPKVFLPKLATTALYSLYAVWAARLAIKVSTIPIEEASAEFTGVMQEALFLLSFSVAIYFIDLVSYAMYPSIVSAHNKGKEVKLSQALSDALKAWKVILALGILVQVLIVVTLLTAGAMEKTALESSNPWYSALAVLFILLSAIAFSILLFFTIPLAVLENKGIIQSLKESVSMGRGHVNELFKINLLFIILALSSMTLGLLSEFEGTVAVVAIGAFIAVRLVQALIYTYMCVVNPYVYLHVKEK